MAGILAAAVILSKQNVGLAINGLIYLETKEPPGRAISATAAADNACTVDIEQVTRLLNDEDDDETDLKVDLGLLMQAHEHLTRVEMIIKEKWAEEGQKKDGDEEEEVRERGKRGRRGNSGEGTGKKKGKKAGEGGGGGDAGLGKRKLRSDSGTPSGKRSRLR